MSKSVKVFSLPSRTKSDFKRECDINEIVERARKFGGIPPPTSAPQWADVSSLGDFLQCQMKVKNAESLFAALPAKVRAKFENSPAQCLAFLADPRNREEAVKMGLVNPPKQALKPVEPTVAAPDTSKTKEV